MSESGSSSQLDFDKDEGVGTDGEMRELRFRALLSESCAERLELTRA